ncbi:MAG: AAA family ATPase [Candidatus Gastranaerophilaceae bacterium]
MTIKIITLSGKQFCGKDTVAKILLERLEGFRRIGLADAIKIKYANKTGLTVEEIEKNKSKYRPDLIALGNEGRAINPDYWINTILEQNNNVIVPDVRMPHEVERFKENNAFCIRVEASQEARSKRGVLSRENDYTEIALDNFNNWDFVIDNEGSYEELQAKIDGLISAILKHFDI